jgi:hypothetical protein
MVTVWLGRGPRVNSFWSEDRGMSPDEGFPRTMLRGTPASSLHTRVRCSRETNGDESY